MVFLYKKLIYVYYYCMRKVNLDIKEIIEIISNLKGQSVKMHVNKGRKRIEKYTGIIEHTYPRIFTVKLNENNTQSYLSYSYSEVLCGAVKIKKDESNSQKIKI